MVLKMSIYREVVNIYLLSYPWGGLLATDPTTDDYALGQNGSHVNKSDAICLLSCKELDYLNETHANIGSACKYHTVFLVGSKWNK